MQLVVILAWGELIRAVYSDDPRRRMWGADKILSSWLARDHPLAPARRGASVSVSESRTISFRWGKPDGSHDEPATESFERDGKAFEVPKYGGGGDRADDPIDGELVKQPVLIERVEPPVPAEPPAAAVGRASVPAICAAGSCAGTRSTMIAAGKLIDLEAGPEPSISLATPRNCCRSTAGWRTRDWIGRCS